MTWIFPSLYIWKRTSRCEISFILEEKKMLASTSYQECSNPQFIYTFPFALKIMDMALWTNCSFRFEFHIGYSMQKVFSYDKKVLYIFMFCKCCFFLLLSSPASPLSTPLLLLLTLNKKPKPEFKYPLNFLLISISKCRRAS